MKTKRQRKIQEKFRLQICMGLEQMKQKYGLQASRWPEDCDEWREIVAARINLEKFQENLAKKEAEKIAMKKQPPQKSNSKTYKEREKKIIDGLKHNWDISIIIRSTHSNRKDILSVAKKYNIPIEPKFTYRLHSNNPALVDLYLNSKASISGFIGYKKGTWIRPDIYTKLGYHLTRIPTSWAKVPLGAMVATGTDDDYRIKDNEDFNQCAIVDIKDLKR